MIVAYILIQSSLGPMVLSFPFRHEAEMEAYLAKYPTARLTGYVYHP